MSYQKLYHVKIDWNKYGWVVKVSEFILIDRFFKSIHKHYFNIIITNFIALYYFFIIFYLYLNKK